MGENQEKKTSNIPEVQNDSPAENINSENSQPSPVTQPQTTSDTPTIPPTPKFKKTNKSILIGLIILVITAVIGGTYLYLQNQLQKSQTEENSITQEQSSPTLDPIADWKTYTDENFNFQIKYPSGWEFSKNEDDWEYGMQYVWIISPDFISKDIENRIVEGVVFSIAIHEDTQVLLQDIINIVNESGGSKSPFTINEINGTLLFEENSPFKNSKRKTFVTQKGGQIYAIELIWSKQIPEAEKTLDQILSTFQFTE
jgi:hypothetical protein